MKKNHLIKLAMATHAHGLKGEVVLHLMNPDQENTLLGPGLSVWLFPNNNSRSSKLSALSQEGEQWKIEKIRWGSKILCEFEGIRDRTHIEGLLPLEIYLEREFFPTLDEGEFYLVDLEGAEVFEYESQIKVGTLTSFSDNGAQTILHIQNLKKEEMLLPFIDQFVPEVNVEEKKIWVCLPLYLDA